MPRPTKGPRLGGGPAHERLLLNNLATQLFAHRSIQTTEAKAKRVRPLAERMVTFAKRGDLHARRRVLRNITDKGVVHELFTEIAPLVAERQGGYTRITKTGFRKGDNAPMAVIELVLEPVTPKRSPVTSRQGSSRAAAVSAPVAEPVAAPASSGVAEEAPAEKDVAEQQAADSEAEVAATNVPGTEDAPVATDEVPPVRTDPDAPSAS